MEDKHPVPGDNANSNTHSDTPSFSWWDIQDENASLPVKEARQSHLHKFFGPSDGTGASSGGVDEYTNVAKGALKSFGKVVSNAVGGSGGGHATSGGSSDDASSPTIKVIAFKLLDLGKMQDDFTTKNHSKSSSHHHQQQQPSTQRNQYNHSHHRNSSVGSSHSGGGYTAPTPQQRQTHRAPATAPTPTLGRQQVPAAAASTATPPTRAGGVQPTPAAKPQQQQAQRPQPQPAQEASLMDFGTSPSSSFSNNGSKKSSPPANETRAQKLKREYAEKNSNSRRVWDEIDERWVEVEPAPTATAARTASSLSSSGGSLLGGIGSTSFDNNSNNGGVEKKKEIGISLDPSNAVGKSANVQAAVHARVNEMRQSQAKALQEVRERETKKKQDEYEEDIIRKQLEPKIKVWSEEHGKKKQLRALLASLHTILWPGAQWKQVTIGDLLDGKKVKVQFHKASRVVHPDKTHHLPPDQRFLAKRIFDALSQAKNEFEDNGGK